MAITASDLKVIVRGTFLGQQWEVVQWYRTDGAAFLTADPVGVGEAYWNDVKTAFRAIPVGNADFRFMSVFVAEPGSTGAYGEFSVPPAEQQGSRSVGTNQWLPIFTAMGIRLTVATRVTRPGQKRIPGWVEADQSANLWDSSALTLGQAVAAKFSGDIALGAPVATGVLSAEIVRLDAGTGLVVAKQDVTGYVINPYVTTQNSRKIGRGS